MLISTHVLVGTAIGRALSSRYDAKTPLPPALLLAGAAGVVSHFACDSLPHWGGGPDGLGVRNAAFLRVAIPDGLTGLALMSLAVLPESMPRKAIVFASALGACLPDSDKVGEFVVGRSPWPAWLDAWHGRIQRESPRLLPTDIAIIGALAAVLFRRRQPGRPLRS